MALFSYEDIKDYLDTAALAIKVKLTTGTATIGKADQGAKGAAGEGWYVQPGTSTEWSLPAAQLSTLATQTTLEAVRVLLAGTLATRQIGGSPVAFTVAVTDVAGKLKATTFPVIPGSVSVEVTAGSGGAVSIGGATVTSADLANAIGSREDGLYWSDLTNVYAVCAAGKTATLLVRAVTP